METPHLELRRNVVGWRQGPDACSGPIGEVPVQEALVAAVVTRRRQVRVHHVLERRFAGLEHEDCTTTGVSGKCGQDRSKEGNRRRTARVGDIAEVADTGKVGICREEVVDVLSEAGI